MSAEGLATGLAKHVDKFTDADANGLPPGAPEADYFILEAALQRGFEMIDDDGDVYVCNSRQVVELVRPYRDAALRQASTDTESLQTQLDVAKASLEWRGRRIKELEALQASTQGAEAVAPAESQDTAEGVAFLSQFDKAGALIDRVERAIDGAVKDKAE